MARKSKNNDFKKYLKFILPIVILILLVVLFFSYPSNNSSSSTTNSSKDGSEKFSFSLFGNNDNSCKYNDGENCLNTQSKCICKGEQICSPDRSKSDNLGCYTPFCGDGYIDDGETSGTCCIDAGCSGSLICDANLNQCVKPQCPFDCCVNDAQYQDKFCLQYYSCNSLRNSCEPDDSDNDAFPDYLEIQTGTDRFNPDTDGDSVLDGYDNHPLFNYLPRIYNFDWRYGKEWLIFTKKFEFDLTLSEDIVTSYEKMPKINLISRDDSQLKEVAQIMNNLADAEGYNDADKLMMVIAFSRSFNYDYTKLNFNKPLPDWANFPMETIIKKEGLCADSAVMAVALLKEMGYDTKYLVGPCYEPDTGSWHAIVGIPFVEGITLDGSERYLTYNGKKYYYLDATSRDYSGNIFYSTTSKNDFGTTYCPANNFVVSDD
ncbi:MAG: hypothetical protein COV33_02570 [Candidatus Zambryskibacteria bacterium CG10_big_fil_rev_8_21_14_0_10_34_34]|uniref:Transglutaminase-like domain-containing protein n=1 Tax=Candidatus Zambryskibacteria bacterium CG10_big_fil_rev_8_21_14_0_10_34_34 TaxID=1975114 RepID=A0A2H0R262_9BACT|nr:MAG: hypothetical protein COV33_02570 [Candidatus Zambryskibacteria bacterium CG10_big_fil_rev_8_21_14_0_10_34_34]